MQKLEEPKQMRKERSSPLLPVTASVAARNEARNLPRCLESLRDVGEVYVIDSQSTDATGQIAESYGAPVVQFRYQGGWPKKRQWAMESLPLAHDWVFLVDADEALTPELSREIQNAIQNSSCDGYAIASRMFFLRRELRHSGASFEKLSLFRRGEAHYECRLREENASMADMEVHEHVVVDGETARPQHPLLHHNVESLSHYIRKHDEYSDWDAKVWLEGEASSQEVAPPLFGSQRNAAAGCARSHSQFWVRRFCSFSINTFFAWDFLTASPDWSIAVCKAYSFFTLKQRSTS
jgi:glycosyltransferase involved in cell wall biosynthesis